MFADPNFIAPDFAAVSLGYLSLHERRLPALIAVMPRANSLRERAIVAAIRWRAENPTAAEAVRQPLRFERRPDYATVRQ